MTLELKKENTDTCVAAFLRVAAKKGCAAKEK